MRIISTRSIAFTTLLGLTTAGCAAPEGDGAAPSTAQEITATCPSGNGFYTLYYGTADSEIATIRAARPNFVVVANEDAAWPDKYHYDNPTAHTGPTGIKVIAYIPMNYGYENQCATPANLNLNSSCTNVSCNGCGNCVAIQTRISNAMARGYDGVFFDETDSSSDSYNVACYNAVKASGSGKLVIDNPGTLPDSASIFNAADIVSVENDYNVAMPAFGVPSWRWLAVQGDPSGATSLADAESRFTTFRGNGGYWYYSSTPHWALHTWYSDFATWAKGQGNVSCSGGSFSVTVNALDMDHANAPVNGMCVFIDGTSSCAGFTPFTTTLSAGSHTITMTNFAPNTFNHWDNGSTTAARTVNVTGNSTYAAYYHTM